MYTRYPYAPPPRIVPQQSYIGQGALDEDAWRERDRKGFVIVEKAIGVGVFLVNAIRAALSKYQPQPQLLCLGFGPVKIPAGKKAGISMLDLQMKQMALVISLMENQERRQQAVIDAALAKKTGKKRSKKAPEMETVEIGGVPQEVQRIAHREGVSREGATIVLSMQPQLPFRPSMLLFDTSCREGISINDVKIGKNSMLLSSNPVPASTIHGLELRYDTVNVGQNLTISVNNISDHDIDFSGMFVGESLQ